VTHQIKVLVKRDWGRRWHLEQVVEIEAASMKEAIKLVRGFYPRKKGSMPRAFKPVSDPTLFALRGVHGRIFSSLNPRQEVSGRKRTPEVTA
jgi:hypothetical protein